MFAVANAVTLLVRLLVLPKWRPGIGVTVLATAGLLIATIIGFYLYMQSPSVIYKDLLGERPTPDVIIEHSQSFSFADSGDAHLVFKCSPSTATRLTARMTPGDGYFGGSSAPSWWTIPSGPTIQVWHFETTNAGFANEFQQFWYDPVAGRASYLWDGVD